ncbi:MAG: isocitrate lyase/phosphoenolpyruvate mutase family protein, partial [Sphaerochaetaceae bacterium]|nr:isocitrate lyase/phosphoenolpyruvate mutase family protein [Sphaerochaetaceae bacterium]
MAEKQIFAPIVWDVMSAKCAEASGFEATLLSGGVVAGNCATPDIGLITSDDLVRITGYVCQASKLPCCIDADDGYGETPLHAYRTTKR